MPIKVPKRTLAIQKNCVGRLSPDLAELSTKFQWEIRKNGLLVLDGNPGYGRELRTWKVNGKGKSAMISLKAVVEKLGINAKTITGKTYPVRVWGKKLFVKFE